ncbi:carbohydrate-binding domain-containing protein [Pseudobutyrivibrio xylanivorans]|uniref:Carbohydrate-binding domain-containing protein n=1 Tax=Pseudobutyrivibrio xylanivorans TaxID=185007 RepID=A0A5P6VR87_PSEXY|nr:carbohydrate-binding domain-containing protein [Pseudobutyrivibrio xylanivorans]QFJ55205.1 carbohydrate-binding domain-containing protein [Pseudobutyrivibrio xylanivorans]
MKRRIVLALMGLMIIGTLAGCGAITSASNTGDSGSATTAEVTSTKVANSENATSTIDDYKALTVNTDWEEKASVTFTESGMTIDGAGATNEDGVLCITEGGAYTLTGSSSATSIVINTEENVKLILNGVELTSTNGPVIYGAQVKNLYIELASGTTNTLEDSSDYATDSSSGEEIGKGVISCEDDIIILGDGTLNITANHKHGIVSDDKLYIESGNINIVSKGTDGIHANDLISIDGGSINIEAASDMMESEDLFVINGGTITGSSDDEGLEAKGSIYIYGGEIDITTVDDAINAGYYIEINDGKITVTSTNGDAIDCNGNYDGCITINGGEVNATGAQVPEGALDADEASVIINGGKVTASGGCNSPIIENGGENNITGETSTGGGPGGGFGGNGGPGGNGGQKPDGEPPEGFSEGERPELPSK